jgi:hypothetical protein
MFFFLPQQRLTKKELNELKAWAFSNIKKSLLSKSKKQEIVSQVDSLINCLEEDSSEIFLNLKKLSDIFTSIYWMISFDEELMRSQSLFILEFFTRKGIPIDLTDPVLLND